MSDIGSLRARLRASGITVRFEESSNTILPAGWWIDPPKAATLFPLGSGGPYHLEQEALEAAEKAHEQYRSRLFEYHKDGDALLHGRINALLVSQSMMLAAFAASMGWSADHKTLFQNIFPYIIMIFGVIIVSIFGHVNNALNKRLTALKTLLIEVDKVYRIYLLESVGHKDMADRDNDIVPKLLPAFLPFLFSALWLVMVTIKVLLPG